MASNETGTSIDALAPKEMARKAVSIGIAKVNLDFSSTLILAVLAGIFIAFGACFCAAAITGSNLGLGVTKLIGAVCFSMGLILVVVGGAELFTGNCLITIAALNGKVSLGRLLRNWVIVYIGNLIGSLVTVVLVYYACQWKMGEMAVGVTAYNTAGAKLSLSFSTALCSGILCNVLVCLAVWLCYSARSTTDKIFAVIPPVAAFITLGFEHCVANMYIIPYAMMLARTGEFIKNPAIAGALKYDPSLYTPHNFLVNNLLPVTIGNIIGGAVFVGMLYWFIYLRSDKSTKQPEPAQASERQPLDVRR